MLGRDESAVTAVPYTNPSDYRIASQIGHGRYSYVFLAFRDAEAFAVKILKPFDNAGNRAAVEREYRINKILENGVPNTLKLKDAVLSLDHAKPLGFALVFQALFRPIVGPMILNMSLRFRLNVVDKLWETVRKAHELGVVHLDIEPTNVLVDRWSWHENYICVKLIDWGLAQKVNEKTGRRTEMSRMGIGSVVHWRIPGAGDVKGVDDLRMADLWSLSCLIFWLLTRQDLFYGKSSATKESRAAVAMKINDEFGKLELSCTEPSKGIEQSRKTWLMVLQEIRRNNALYDNIVAKISCAIEEEHQEMKNNAENSGQSA